MNNELKAQINPRFDVDFTKQKECTKDEKRRSALFQLNKFLWKNPTIHNLLNVYDVMVLFTIARYLDLPERRCYGKQVTLAKTCRMARTQFYTSCKNLEKLKLIERWYCKGQHNYRFGETITGISRFTD